MRIGIGYDVHRLTEGRDLVLGGVRIPHKMGLDGHSDADVLVHAIMDALLGAIGAGDIGKLFPDTDPQYKGIDSMLLLAEVIRRVEAAGYCIGNIDAVVIAQKPKLGPHFPAMKERLAQVMHCEENRINLKATTEEHLGFTGREEGIAAEAVCLLEEFA
ncbi:MAG: 2-C-methyl-D-erythritol 2,4-cyclodiphosphate synthase [Firmicutes bacterium]|nr:2-C-methyl-D-erythritol 2,4-cyclodiphosphate synthase [Bacillota bacterium]